MPQKPKFTREEIVDAAYTLMERGGMEAVVAREVGKALGSTVAPIFTCFANMEELKAAVHARAIAECAEYFRDFMDYFPAFKEFGLRWVRLAKEHPHVYSELFLGKNAEEKGLFGDELREMLAPVRAEIIRTFSVSEADAESVLGDLLLYVHGIAAMQISGYAQISDEQLRISLSRVCLSLVAGCQVRDGSAGNTPLHTMFGYLDLVPRRKSEMGNMPPLPIEHHQEDKL